jgi:foldase protein PrsA
VSKRVRFIPALGAVLFALVGLSACGGLPGDAVVQIEGKSITKATFSHWLAIAATANSAGAGAVAAKPVVPEPPDYKACIAHLQQVAPKPAKGQEAPTTASLKKQCVTQYGQLLKSVLPFLISSTWLLEEGSHMGIKLSDAEVKKQFEKIKGTQFPKAADYEKFLANTGQSTSDILLRVKLNQLSAKIEEKIAKEKHTVSKAEIEKYYNANKQRFGTPEKRTIEIILSKTEAAAASAKREVESGKSFASVAKRVSIDPTSKATGGLLTEVIPGQEEKALSTAIFAAKLNVLGGPLKSAFGYYVYRVKSATPATQQSLAQAEASIKTQLTSTQSSESLKKFVTEFRKRWKARTDCRSEFVVANCKQFKEPPKTTTPGTATP